MKNNLIHLMTAEIIQFWSEKEINSNTSQYYAKRMEVSCVGILENDYFLDINTYQLYPIIHIGANYELTDAPIIGIQYVTGLKPYASNNRDEIENIVKKATEAHRWFESIEEMEKTNNIIYFQKRKIQLLKQRQWYKPR